jgi:ABC-type oligopeptide transport system ATPase subunit
MEPLLSIEHLKKYFNTERGIVRAVDDISFHINRGETFGLVGESGSGKSTTAFTHEGYETPTIHQERDADGLPGPRLFAES